MSLVLQSCRDGIGIVSLNRPKKRNALNAPLIAELRLALLAMARQARVILLRGEGQCFCAGADLESLTKLDSEVDVRTHAEATGALFETLGNLPIPTIAVVRGHALGAGCGLVSLCDLAIATPDAKLGYPEFGHGILPALVTPPLVRAVGTRRAFQILAFEEAMSASDAMTLGLIGKIDSDPDAASEGAARHLAGASRRQLAAFKALIGLCANTPVDQQNQAAIEANIADKLAQKRPRPEIK